MPGRGLRLELHNGVSRASSPLFAWPGLSPNNLISKKFPQWQVGIAIASRA